MFFWTYCKNAQSATKFLILRELADLGYARCGNHLEFSNADADQVLVECLDWNTFAWNKLPKTIFIDTFLLLPSYVISYLCGVAQIPAKTVTNMNESASTNAMTMDGKRTLIVLLYDFYLRKFSGVHGLSSGFPKSVSIEPNVNDNCKVQNK